LVSRSLGSNPRPPTLGTKALTTEPPLFKLVGMWRCTTFMWTENDNLSSPVFFLKKTWSLKDRQRSSWPRKMLACRYRYFMTSTQRYLFQNVRTWSGIEPTTSRSSGEHSTSEPMPQFTNTAYNMNTCELGDGECEILARKSRVHHP